MSETLDMFEPEARADVGVFDHEEHAPGELTGAGARRRRREIADWGVDEDVFDRLPGRRFARDDDGVPAVSARERVAPPTRERTAEPAPAAKSGDTGSWLAEREEARRATARRSAAEAEAGVRVLPVDEQHFTPSPTASAPAAAAPAGSVPGRRTIVIGTRHNAALAQQRRRPPRTAADRVGHRPDRIVGWMVAMGLLLIVIAILSAGH